MSRAGDQNPGVSVFSKTVIEVALQVGCLTFALILVSLIIGVWLDRSFDTLPLFTILFLVGSMPVSWVVVFRVVNKAKSKIVPGTAPQGAQTSMEDENSD